MFKEFILAIILGALLGFGLTGGYFALNTNNKNRNNSLSPAENQIPIISSDTENKTTPPPATNQANTNILVVDNPENESIVSNSKTTVSGKSSPKSTIIITTFQKTYSQSTKEDGLFSIDIDLESGANKVNVTSIDTQDNQTNLQLMITYSTAKI